MKKNKLFLIGILPLIMLLTACGDFLDPLPNGTIPEDQIWNRPDYVKGFVGHAYSYMPSDYNNNRGYFLDGATDDAVLTNKLHAMNRFGIGTMSTSNDPFKNDIYADSYKAIVSVNRFLVDFKGLNTRFSINARENELTRKRLHGEAYALRAWYQWELLKYYGGVGAKSGKLLGISIIKGAFQDLNVDTLWKPRSTYFETINQIQQDCDSAFKYLAKAHRDYLKEFPTDVQTGAILWGAMDQMALRAMLSQMYLTYASPLYNPNGETDRWLKAAEAAKAAMDLKESVDGTRTPGFVKTDRVNWNDANFPGIIFPSSYSKADLSAEKAFYPASLKGGHSGVIGATQELVDAFPMANGYPITDSRSGYDPQNPYVGRDKRFYSTIFYNGAQAKLNNVSTGAIIQTFESWSAEVDGATVLGKDYAGVPKTSLTNYHIKKFLYMNYNPNDNLKLAGGPRSKYFYRWAHVVLDFAEAANEVGGPNFAVGGLTAKDAIVLLRKRKTYDNETSSFATSDPYLTELAASNDKALFREFIRNERRLETCFEGLRFFDLKRWSTENDLSLLNKTVHRPVITKDMTTGTYQYSDGTAAKPHVEVGKRNFTTPYLPLPYDEILRLNAIEQNKGWNSWE